MLLRRSSRSWTEQYKTLGPPQRGGESGGGELEPEGRLPSGGKVVSFAVGGATCTEPGSTTAESRPSASEADKENVQTSLAATPVTSLPDNWRKPPSSRKPKQSHPTKLVSCSQQPNYTHSNHTHPGTPHSHTSTSSVAVKEGTPMYSKHQQTPAQVSLPLTQGSSVRCRTTNKSSVHLDGHWNVNEQNQKSRVAEGHEVIDGWNSNGVSLVDRGGPSRKSKDVPSRDGSGGNSPPSEGGGAPDGVPPQEGGGAPNGVPPQEGGVVSWASVAPQKGGTNLLTGEGSGWAPQGDGTFSSQKAGAVVTAPDYNGSVAERQGAVPQKRNDGREGNGSVESSGKQDRARHETLVLKPIGWQRHLKVMKIKQLGMGGSSKVGHG